MMVICMHEMANMDEWLYGINYKYNVLCKINVHKQVVEKFSPLCIDGEEMRYMSEYYNHILATESSVYVLNTCANKLFVFNTELQLIENVILLDTSEHMSIIGIKQNLLFMYAVSSGIIIGLDIRTKEITKYYIPSKYVGKVNTREIKMIDNSLWITGYIGNVILEFGIKNGEMYEHKIDIVKGDICLCSSYGDNFWLCTQYEIIEWCREKHTIKKVIEFPSVIKRYDMEMPFCYSTIINDKMCLFPLTTNYVLAMDINMDEIVLFSIEETSGKKCCRKPFGYLEKINSLDIVYGLDCSMNNVGFQMGIGEISGVSFKVDNRMFEKIKKQFYKKNRYLNEKFFDISELIDDVKISDLLDYNSNVGRKIYNSLFN